MYEHFFECVHCGEEISMLLDSSVQQQKYIEDCEICCNPIELEVSFEDGALKGFSAEGIGQ